MRWFRKRRGSDDDDQLPLDDPSPPPLPSAQRFTRGDGRIYRVVRIASGSDARGRLVYRSGVGVSDVSQADAESEARAGPSALSPRHGRVANLQAATRIKPTVGSNPTSSRSADRTVKSAA